MYSGSNLVSLYDNKFGLAFELSGVMEPWLTVSWHTELETSEPVDPEDIMIAYASSMVGAIGMEASSGYGNYMKFYVQGTDSLLYPKGIFEFVAADYTGSGTFMYVTPTGVGIGTSTPAFLFSVVGSGAPRITVGAVNGADADGRLAMVYDVASHTAGINAFRNPSYRQLGIDGSPLVLNVNSAAAVGIGTLTPAVTEPYDRLTIQGNDGAADGASIINTGIGQAFLNYGAQVERRAVGRCTFWVVRTNLAFTIVRRLLMF